MNSPVVDIVPSTQQVLPKPESGRGRRTAMWAARKRQVYLLRVGAAFGQKALLLPNTMDELLSMATTTLKLKSRATRVFSEGGDEYNADDIALIANHEVLYISCGEEFKQVSLPWSNRKTSQTSSICSLLPSQTANKRSSSASRASWRKVAINIESILNDTAVIDAWRVKRLSKLHPFVVEFVATILLVWGAVLGPTFGILEPLANGILATLLVAAGASISGAHYNPALTLAFLIAKKGQGLRTSCAYIVLQLIASLLGSTLAHFFSAGVDPFDPNGVHCGTVCGVAGWLASTDSSSNPHAMFWARSLLASLIATFVLCVWVCYIALVVHPPLGNFGPVTVGMVVYVLITSFAPVGGCPNPAVTLGFWFEGMFCHAQQEPATVLLAFWALQMLGGGFAGSVVWMSMNLQSKIKDARKRQKVRKELEEVTRLRSIDAEQSISMQRFPILSKIMSTPTRTSRNLLRFSTPTEKFRLSTQLSG